MAENVLGLILLLIYPSFIEYSKINPENESIVLLSSRGVAPKLIKATLE
ncbi:MAG: hypothetical protein MJE68_17935 [Proteobacteria bacterium]|nr:hypothetical protein [Pseudomonadota bacterium]